MGRVEWVLWSGWFGVGGVEWVEWSAWCGIGGFEMFVASHILESDITICADQFT